MLLGLGSPAIDAANDATCAAAPINNLDQRGVTRPRGAHCDIGAVEQQPYSATNVLKVPDDYPMIQSAIDAATVGARIWVAHGIYEENLSITKGITLSGGWDDAFTERTPGDSTIDGKGVGPGDQHHLRHQRHRGHHRWVHGGGRQRHGAGGSAGAAQRGRRDR